MKDTNPVWPWKGKEAFNKRISQYNFISEKLASAGLPITQNKPNKATIREASAVFDLIEKVPITLVTSGNQGTLSTIEKIVPQAVALTRLKSVAGVDTIELAGLFRARRPLDIWQDDPTGEHLDYLGRVFLLVWKRVNDTATRQRDLGGQFSRFIRGRIDQGKPILITALMNERGKAAEAKLQTLMDSHYNESMQALLADRSITTLYHAKVFKEAL